MASTFNRTPFLLMAVALTGISLSYATSLLGLVGLAAPVCLGLSLSHGSVRSVVVQCTFFGFCSWLWSAWWLSVGINSMNQSYWWAGYLAITALALLGALPYFLFGWLCARLKLLGGAAAQPLVASALLSILVEVCPSPFPGSLVHGLSAAPMLLQLADWGGAALVHFVLYGTGFCVAHSVWQPRLSSRRWRSLVVAASLVVATLTYGGIRMNQVQASLADLDQISIAFVQPNIPIQSAPVQLGPAGSLETLLEQTSALLKSGAAPDLIVWPEIPIYFSPHNSPQDQQRLTELLRGTQTPLVLNADMYTNETVHNRVPFYNAVQLFRGNAEVLEEYRKMILVPLGEYMPFEEYLSGPRFERFLSDLRRYVPGREARVLHPTPEVAIGTPICLEALHTGHIAKFIRAGARVLINPSNDAYFGDSAGARLNFAFSVFRAIEYRVPIVRVTNSGISAVINQKGEVVQGSRLAQFVPATATISVTPSAVVLGRLIARDRGILALALFTVIAMMIGRRRTEA